MRNKSKQSIAIALGAACVASVVPLAKVDASELFSAKEITSGSEIVGSFGKKGGEGKCQDGNCGHEEGKGEQSCGEGRCG
jgi:uncharacterized low-complexity protein